MKEKKGMKHPKKIGKTKQISKYACLLQDCFHMHFFILLKKIEVWEKLCFVECRLELEMSPSESTLIACLSALSPTHTTAADFCHNMHKERKIEEKKESRGEKATDTRRESALSSTAECGLALQPCNCGQTKQKRKIKDKLQKKPWG